jgi:hypothetical protein
MNARRLIPSPAMLVAVIALVLACAGTGYAALRVTGKTVVNASLTGRDMRPNSLGPKQIKESKLGTVASAKNAGKLDGIDSIAFARGRAALSYGGATLTLPDPEQVLDTPVGRFELDCLGGIQGADARYRNTTGAPAHVWRTRVTGNGIGGTTLSDSAAPGEHHGFAYEDPSYGVIRVVQGGQVAELRAHSVENGADCRFDWELVQSQS